MKSFELNKLLLENFPNLKEKYQDEVSWQDGDETGSHIVYGDVFTPYIIECIKNEKDDEVIAIFNYLEIILFKQDEYASEVITFSVIESILFLVEKNSKYVKLMGNETKKVFDELNNFK